MAWDERVLHSRRSLNLRFDIPISKTAFFWESLRSGKFVTTKCKSCGQVSFPPQADCPNCMSAELEWIAPGNDVDLVTYTQVLITPASFVTNDPYIIGIAKLPNGLKILAWVEGATIEKLQPGSKLKIEARTSPEGNPYIVFVPT